MNSLPYINETGGLDILVKKFKETGIWPLINKSLGKRNARAVFSYSDIIQQKALSAIIGAKRLEHCEEHTHKFRNNPIFRKGAGADTISRVTRRLACSNTYYTKVNSREKIKNVFVPNPTEKEKLVLNEVNYNEKLNALLLDSAIKLGLLKKGAAYSLDIDATIIPTKVSDSRVHYKKTGTGYCPMVVMLGGIPIFMEARNGNSSSMFRIKNALQTAIELIESKGIKIKFVRIDAAGSNKSVFAYLQKRKIKFYIRASDRLESKISRAAKRWNKIKYLGLLVCERRVNYTETEMRQVNYKNKNKKEWGIVTNNETLSAVEIIKLYNQRAVIEQRFSDLKSIGWHYMVHHEMKFNTVHMLLTILSYLLFLSAKRWLSTKLKFITDKIEPLTFIKKFVRVITTWHQEEIIFITRRKEFEKLIPELEFT